MGRQKELNIRIVSERVVSRKNPTEVIGTRPEDFPRLARACKEAAALFETGQQYQVIDENEAG